MTEPDLIHEYLGYCVYSFFYVQVPKFKVNDNLLLTEKLTPPYYKHCKVLERFRIKKGGCHNDLGRLLAVALLIGDSDVLGSEDQSDDKSNILLNISDNSLVKIDPGEAFGFIKWYAYHHAKKDYPKAVEQAQAGINKQEIAVATGADHLQIDKLSDEIRKDFFDILNDILAKEERLLQFLEEKLQLKRIEYEYRKLFNEALKIRFNGIRKVFKDEISLSQKHPLHHA